MPASVWSNALTGLTASSIMKWRTARCAHLTRESELRVRRAEKAQVARDELAVCEPAVGKQHLSQDASLESARVEIAGCNLDARQFGVPEGYPYMVLVAFRQLHRRIVSARSAVAAPVATGSPWWNTIARETEWFSEGWPNPSARKRRVSLSWTTTSRCSPRWTWR